jgi:hypothetical protein
MSKTLRSILWVIMGVLILVIAGHFLLPFGIVPKWASMNCGPEHWRWLDRPFSSEGDVIIYLQNNASDLLSGRLKPHRDNNAVDWSVSQTDVNLFNQSIAKKIVVERRFGYYIYTLTYHRPACSESQTFIFKVTSYGFASLYGCCGI